jgi:phage baseplate assembly protein W
MDVDYGVGISRYLFSSKIDVASSQIENKIRQQVTAYLPIIKIKSIDFTNQMDNNTLGITIVYDIPDIGTRDILQFAL